MGFHSIYRAIYMPENYGLMHVTMLTYLGSHVTGNQEIFT